MQRQGVTGQEVTGASGTTRESVHPPGARATPLPRPSQLLKAALGSDKFFERRSAILRHQVG